PAKEHCRQVAQRLGATQGVIYLKGFNTPMKGQADTELPFYQDPNFYYLAGAAEPGLTFTFDIATNRGTLWVPKMHDDEVIWVGEQESLAELRAKYPVDEVEFSHGITDCISTYKSTTIFTMDYENGQELAAFQSAVDKTKLKPCIEESRMFKTPEEITIMRKANDISSHAHANLMRFAEPGMNERELYAKFTFECARRGGISQAYGGIVGRGTNAAILHYTKNDADLRNLHDVVLVDAGCEYQGYASDITRVFPVGKKFTPEARAIYSLVLKMQKTALHHISPGVQWEDLHREAMQVCAQGLLELGILQGDLADIIAHHIPAVFFPHGLGHSIGLDVHDVAGYPEGVGRIPEPGIRYLRMRRRLEPGMVVTVEPGCYFVGPLIAEALQNPDQAQFINQEVLDRYMSVGGVRIEDSVVVTKFGHDNLTTAPK
ncbi:peptidase M24, structural domain-containing protein, partial [Dimargaris cristalligena]